jgi:hypothetical protein
MKLVVGIRNLGLHYGARFGHKEIIKFLLLRGPPSLIG